ncbi:MAG: GNAT family N-acetyltransferase [Burkholderiales bacterium PBB3]|nr:MAG: GNAT family N-acetyltransferase [Burkholderiales bacterium PBB3]
MSARSYDPVRKLDASDRVAGFNCGQPELDQYLQRFALGNQKANSANTYVACCAGDVVGFYSLAVGSVVPSAATSRVIKGLPQHPVPVMLLARLAVDHTHQGAGLGRALLKDALIRTARAADIAGIRALLAHSKDEEVRNWYLQWEFEPSATDPLHLYLLMKDLKAMVSNAA